jgi:hypothetical protein
MAIIFAIRDGLKDAKTGRPPYFFSVFTDANERRSLLTEGWHAILKIFFIAIILDSVFQFIVFRWIYPVEALLVALLLAFVPPGFAGLSTGSREYLKLIEKPMSNSSPDKG